MAVIQGKRAGEGAVADEHQPQLGTDHRMCCQPLPVGDRPKATGESFCSSTSQMQYPTGNVLFLWEGVGYFSMSCCSRGAEPE